MKPRPRTTLNTRSKGNSRPSIAAPWLAALLIVSASPFNRGSLLARTSPGEEAASPGASKAEAGAAQKLPSAAVQIEPIGPGEVTLPPEFRMAVYENLIEEVRKTRKFQHVYRSGDRAAVDVPDLVVLRTKLEGFKQGSQRQREVTTVAGATSINVRVQVTAWSGPHF